MATTHDQISSFSASSFRGQYDEKICPSVNHFDIHFSTSFDGMLAEMMANELLLEYVEERLKPTCMAVEAAPSKTAAAAASPALRWTGHMRDLVEIGYALYLHGDFGDASIREIMESFEVAFNFDLGEYYDHFADIRQRKNSTIFLDKLKTHLVRYIEREDD